MLSYARGRAHPLLEKTIWETFRDTAARVPDRMALSARRQGIRWTFSELMAKAEETARGLTGLGLRAQDRVGIWSSNCAEWILLQLACARAGLVLVNVNPAYRSWELRYVLEKSLEICRGQLGKGPLIDNARAGADMSALLAEPI